ncbi:MAG: multidrug ABC transporter ATP-binding protein [Bacteroidetes bacterium]|nr:MAG: multidrug ABC transporter ATP-binding protein [Bacteroidota bacterium]
MGDYLIETRSLSYEFSKGEKILNDLNLKIPKGSVYGFLGPNGAGKTTTLRLILGLLRKQRGLIEIFGKDFSKNRIQTLSRLGSLIEQPSIYGHLTGKENLELFRKTYGCNRSRIAEVLDIVKLTAAGGKKAKNYSLGMKQKLAIAIALLHDPELLILDEPTNGLDPGGIIQTRELINKLNKDFGKTIVVSSHLLSEVEKMATHVGIINKGNLLFQGSLSQLQQLKSRQSTVEVEVNDTQKAGELVKSLFPVKEINGKKILLEFETKERVAQLTHALVHGGIQVYQVAVMQNDLENLFIQITSE